MSAAVTFAGLAPAWEIDANRHWSTVFYLRAFEAASLRHGLASGMAGAPPARVLHLRFVRELGIGDTLRVESRALAAAEPYDAAHAMRHGATGALAATALELRDGARPGPEEERAGEAAPRGLPPGAQPPEETAALLAQRRAAISHAGVLEAGAFDAGGALSFAGLQSRVADGNGPLWQHLGVPSEAFHGRGLGRVNVELKLTRHAPAAPGMAVRLVSRVAEAGERSIRLHHQLEELATGRVLGSAAAVALVIDLERRRATAMPADLRAALGRG